MRIDVNILVIYVFSVKSLTALRGKMHVLGGTYKANAFVSTSSLFFMVSSCNFILAVGQNNGLGFLEIHDFLLLVPLNTASSISVP